MAAIFLWESGAKRAGRGRQSRFSWKNFLPATDIHAEYSFRSPASAQP
jgi:hypothetical protein